jgi:hypothetical protein
VSSNKRMTVIDFESEEAVTMDLGGGAFASTVVPDGKKLTKFSVPPGFDWAREIAVSLSQAPNKKCLCRLCTVHHYMAHLTIWCVCTITAQASWLPQHLSSAPCWNLARGLFENYVRWRYLWNHSCWTVVRRSTWPLAQSFGWHNGCYGWVWGQIGWSGSREIESVVYWKLTVTVTKFVWNVHLALVRSIWQKIPFHWPSYISITKEI